MPACECVLCGCQCPFVPLLMMMVMTMIYSVRLHVRLLWVRAIAVSVMHLCHLLECCNAFSVTRSTSTHAGQMTNIAPPTGGQGHRGTRSEKKGLRTRDWNMLRCSHQNQKMSLTLNSRCINVNWNWMHSFFGFKQAQWAYHILIGKLAYYPIVYRLLRLKILIKLFLLHH